jgi:hypothetical protein
MYLLLGLGCNFTPDQPTTKLPAHITQWKKTHLWPDSVEWSLREVTMQLAEDNQNPSGNQEGHLNH